MDDHPQPPPPTDAPNAGDPTPGTGTLCLGDFIIEGVDRVSEEQDLSDHAIVKIGQPASFIIVVMIDDDVVCVKTKNARGL